MCEALANTNRRPHLLPSHAGLHATRIIRQESPIQREALKTCCGQGLVAERLLFSTLDQSYGCNTTRISVVFQSVPNIETVIFTQQLSV